MLNMLKGPGEARTKVYGQPMAPARLRQLQHEPQMPIAPEDDRRRRRYRSWPWASGREPEGRATANKADYACWDHFQGAGRGLHRTQHSEDCRADQTLNADDEAAWNAQTLTLELNRAAKETKA